MNPGLLELSIPYSLCLDDSFCNPTENTFLFITGIKIHFEAFAGASEKMWRSHCQWLALLKGRQWWQPGPAHHRYEDQIQQWVSEKYSYFPRHASWALPSPSCDQAKCQARRCIQAENKSCHLGSSLSNALEGKYANKAKGCLQWLCPNAIAFSLSLLICIYLFGCIRS